MDVRFEAVGSHLVAHLSDEASETEISTANGYAAGCALIDALDRASDIGYGECFWPEPTGQYWWTFSRHDDGRHLRVEVAVMWSSGTVTGWQHVFRSTDDLLDFSRRAARAIADVTIKT